MIITLAILVGLLVAGLVAAAISEHFDPVERRAARAMAEIDARQAENRWRFSSARDEMNGNARALEQQNVDVG